MDGKHRFQVAALQAWCRQRPGGGLALALASVSVTSYTYYVNYVLCNTSTHCGSGTVLPTCPILGGVTTEPP